MATIMTIKADGDITRIGDTHRPICGISWLSAEARPDDD
jgi:hypothetical protein